MYKLSRGKRGFFSQLVCRCFFVQQRLILHPTLLYLKMKNSLDVSTQFFVILTMVLFICSPDSQAQENSRQEQKQQPAAQIKHNLNQYHGEVVLLDFWASWCGPCRRSFPWMNEMQTKYAERGLKVVAVNLDQEPVDAAKFLDRYPANFTIWYDPKAELAKRYDVQVMPTSVLIDRQGKVLSVHRGFRTKNIQAYEQAIKQAL